MGIIPRRVVLVVIALVSACLPVGLSMAAKQSASPNEIATKNAEGQLMKIGANLDPKMSFEERYAASSKEMNEIARNQAEAAGGSMQPQLPPGVVIRLHPNPLDGIDPVEYAKFCEQVQRLAPDDKSCQLNQLVQEGKIPPGEYTQADIDAVIKETK